MRGQKKSRIGSKLLEVRNLEVEFDTYGGIEKAIEIAVSLAKIEDYRIISLPKKKDPFTELAIKLSNSSSFTDILFTKLGLKTEFSQPIETLLKSDKIQARIPFIITLK